MPKDYSRTQRIADQIQRELAVLIETEVKDPRVGRITITDVEVTRDYSHAKIYYTTLGNEEDRVAIEEGLKHASGFLRSQLASRIRLRVIPQLHFIYDESVERGLYLSQLIDKATGKI